MAPVPAIESDFRLFTAACFAVIVAVVVGCAWCGCGGKGKHKKPTGEEQVSGSLCDFDGPKNLTLDRADPAEKQQLYYVQVPMEDALKSFEPIPAGKVNCITVENARGFIEPKALPIQAPGESSPKSVGLSLGETKGSQKSAPKSTPQGSTRLSSRDEQLKKP